MVSFNPAIINKLNGLSETILNGHYIYSNGVNDDYLAKRFSTPDKFAHNVTYMFTNDPEMLQQYYNIREFAYKETLGVINFSGQEDDFDKHSQILIVKAGNRVIGGARLTISTPTNHNLMPIEEEGFEIKSHFPQLDFSQLHYCEMSRLALLPEFRNHVIAEQIHQQFINLCKEKGVQVGFARTTPLQQRRTKTIFKNLGYEMIIRRDIEIAPYEHLEMQFSSVDFTNDRHFEELLKQQPEPVRAADNIEFA